MIAALACPPAPEGRTAEGPVGRVSPSRAWRVPGSSRGQASSASLERDQLSAPCAWSLAGLPTRG